MVVPDDYIAVLVVSVVAEDRRLRRDQPGIERSRHRDDLEGRAGLVHRLGRIVQARLGNVVETVEMEVMMTDLEVIENRLSRLEKELQSKKDKSSPERDLLEKCKESLEESKPLRDLELIEDELKLLRTFRFLSRKPALVLYNISEDAIGESLPGPGHNA